MMLHVEGNRTRNASGEEVLLTGVNCASLEWDPRPSQLMRTVQAACDQWKSNLIRLPLLPNGWYGYMEGQKADDRDGTLYREFVDDIVNEIAKRGKYIILDLHGSTCGILGQEDYGYMPDRNSLMFWEDLAVRYKDHPNVLFGLFNEPRGIDWEIWRNGGEITCECEIRGEIRVNTFHTPGMKRILEVVRGTGAKNIAVIGGLDWAFSLKGMRDGYMLEDTRGNGIILDTHIYPWKSMDWDGHISCMADRYPILVGECGHSGELLRPENPQKEISSIWVPKLLQWIETRGYHVTAWDFHDCAGPSLVENMQDFTPTPYWGAYYKEFLNRRSLSPADRQTEIEVRVKERSVRFFGRTAEDVEKDLVFFNWSGSGFEFRFVGTKVSGEFVTDLRGGELPPKEEQAHIGVYIDGQEEAVMEFLLDRECGTYTLAEQLPYGPHVVRVVKLSEVGYGRAAVRSLKAVGTMQPLPTQVKERRMEIIGDSISCGYGNTCSNESPEFVTREENGEKTFGRMLARQFDAEVHITAVSGTGVFHDYGMNTRNLLPELYPCTDKMLHEHYGMPAKPWDFNQFRPDIIIIKLGNNDSRYCDGWDKEELQRTEALKIERRMEFKEKYIDFLAQVRRLNPDSEILVFNEATSILINEIVDAVNFLQNRAQDGRLHVMTLPGKLAGEGVGANGHWSVQTHRRAANTLAKKVEELTGWIRKGQE